VIDKGLIGLLAVHSFTIPQVKSALLVLHDIHNIHTLYNATMGLSLG